MNLDSFKPLLDLLQAQYGSTSEVNNEKFTLIDVQTAIEVLLISDSESPEISQSMQMTEVSEITPEIQTHITEVKSHYEARLLDQSNSVKRNHETCLALGLLCQFSVHKADEALKYYESILSMAPKASFTKFVKMLVYSCKKHLAIKTTEIYQDILRWELSKQCQLVKLSETFFQPIYGANSNASFILGIAYHVVKEYDMARTYFQKSVIINPKYCLGWRYLAGILRDHYRKYDLTRRIYDKVLLDVDPSCVQVHYNRGFLLKNEFEKHQEAQDCFEECIRLDPSHISAHNRLADLCVIFQDYKLAEQYAKKALEIDPDHFRSTVDLGHLYRKELNNRTLARMYYEKAIKLRPNEHRVYASLGKLLRKSYYDYNEARKFYQKALELAPTSSRTHLEMGNLLSKHFKDWESARKHYIKSMLVRGDYDKPFKSLKKGESQHNPQSEIKVFIVATENETNFSSNFTNKTADEIAVRLCDFPECFRRRAQVKFKDTYQRIIEQVKSRREVLLVHLNQTCLVRDPAELIVKFLMSSVHLSSRIVETEALFKSSRLL